MSINLLDYFLQAQMAAFFMIFCRIGAALMMMPGFGEIYVSPRLRLMLSLVMALLLTPMLAARIPEVQGSPMALTVAIIGEVMIGGFIGLIARTMLSAMHVAGTMIATQSSLAVAAMFDPSNGSQSPVIANLLSLAALTMFFALNLHHLLIAALVQSYDVFPAGQFPSLIDMNVLYTRLVADTFMLGVMLSAPHIIFSLLFYLGGGLMTRLMPNFQVFFIAMSPQIMIAFFLLLAALPLILDQSMDFVETQLNDFVRVQ